VALAWMCELTRARMNASHLRVYKSFAVGLQT